MRAIYLATFHLIPTVTLEGGILYILDVRSKKKSEEDRPITRK